MRSASELQKPEKQGENGQQAMDPMEKSYHLLLTSCMVLRMSSSRISKTAWESGV